MSLFEKTRFAIFAAAPALAVTLAAGAALAMTTPPSVTVLNQAVKSNAVDITYAYLPTSGHVVVLGSDANGKLGDRILGSAEMKAGDHRDFKVNLTEAPKPGEKLWVSLYDDTDGKPGFDMKADKPVWGDRIPLQNAFIVK